MIYCLIYVSVATKVTLQEELEQILKYSRDWNKHHRITGCLAYIEGRISQKQYCRFIQVLEGPEQELNNLFSNIQEDNRHKEVTLIKHGIIQNRNFGSWEMGFEKISLDNNPALQGFFDLNPQLLSEDGNINNHMLLDFMKSFYKNI